MRGGDVLRIRFDKGLRLLAAGNGLVTERSQRRGGNRIAKAIRVGGDESVADVVGEGGVNITACLNNGTVTRCCSLGCSVSLASSKVPDGIVHIPCFCRVRLHASQASLRLGYIIVVNLISDPLTRFP